MIVATRGLGRRGRLGRLGVNSAVVNGSMIYSNPIAVSRGRSVTTPARPIGPARPVAITNGANPETGGNGIVTSSPVQSVGISNPWGGLYSGTYGGQPAGTYAGNPAQTSQTNLAQLTLLYQTNPSFVDGGAVESTTGGGRDSLDCALWRFQPDCGNGDNCGELKLGDRSGHGRSVCDRVGRSASKFEFEHRHNLEHGLCRGAFVCVAGRRGGSLSADERKAAMSL